MKESLLNLLVKISFSGGTNESILTRFPVPAPARRQCRRCLRKGGIAQGGSTGVFCYVEMISRLIYTSLQKLNGKSDTLEYHAHV